MINSNVKEQIQEQADIVELIGEFVRLKALGRTYKGLCPFHNEKTPSFHVSPDGFFHCFGCGESGDIFAFVMKYLNLTFPEALRFLAERYNIKFIEEVRYTEQDSREAQIKEVYQAARNYYEKALHFEIGDIALQYIHSRNINADYVEQFGLGYSPNGDHLHKELERRGFSLDVVLDSGLVRQKDGRCYDFFRGRLMFPITDFLGKTIAFSGRQLEEDKTQGKYINSADSLVYSKKHTLYGLYNAKSEIRKYKTAIIVEGNLDVISLHQSGIKNVVAPCGTALSREQLRALKKHTKADVLYLLFDGDEAGISAAMKSIGISLECEYDLRLVVLPNGHDPDSYIRNFGKESLVKELKNYKTFVRFIVEKLQNDNLLTTPAEKSTAIDLVITHILAIPDKMQHGFYINELKGFFNVDIAMLRERYRMLRNKSKKVEQVNENSETKEFSVNSDIKELLPEEKEILRFALQSSDYRKLLLEEYEVTSEFFKTDLAITLFELIQEYYEDENLMKRIYADNNITDDLKSVVMELEKDVITIQKDGDYIDNKTLFVLPLNKLRIKKIENEYKELQEQLFTTTDKERIMKRMIELMGEKTKYKM